MPQPLNVTEKARIAAPEPAALEKPNWDNRKLFSMIWPLMIEQALAVTMGAADTVMVSSVGEFAVSGVNIVDNINNLLIIAFAALCTGGTVVVSQFIGRRDAVNARLASRQLLYAALFVSLLIMSLTLIFRRRIIVFFYGRIESGVMDAASIYLLISAVSYPALAVYNAGAALFRSIGNSKITMRTALFVNALNIVGNFFFILVLKFGVAGAALSTLISRAAAALITLVLLIKGRHLPISLYGILKIKIVPNMIRNILNVGIPSGLESSMFQLGRLSTQRIFTTFGTAAIAGNAIAGVINSFSFMPGMAYAMTLLTVVGQCIGAGDTALARKNTAKIIKLAYATIFVINLLIVIFLEQLVSLFNLSGEAHDYAKLFLLIHCASMVMGWTPSFALPNALRAAGDARYVMIAASISMWTIRVSAAYFLCFVIKTGPEGVWLAMGADFIVRSICYITRWKSGKWEKKKVIS